MYRSFFISWFVDAHSLVSMKCNWFTIFKYYFIQINWLEDNWLWSSNLIRRQLLWIVSFHQKWSFKEITTWNFDVAAKKQCTFSTINMPNLRCSIVVMMMMMIVCNILPHSSIMTHLLSFQRCFSFTLYRHAMLKFHQNRLCFSHSTYFMCRSSVYTKCALLFLSFSFVYA